MLLISSGRPIKQLIKKPKKCFGAYNHALLVLGGFTMDLVVAHGMGCAYHKRLVVIVL